MPDQTERSLAPNDRNKPTSMNDLQRENEVGNPADYSSQTPAATAAPQANLRVVRHRFEGTSQAGNVGPGEGGQDRAEEGSAAIQSGCSCKGVRRRSDG